MTTESNNVSSSDDIVPNSLEKKIIRQIEYYFGDVNLLRDKFLKEKIKEDEGWISLETLTTFNRLKSLSTDFDVIISALKKSDSGLLEINDEAKKIRRSKENPAPENSETGWSNIQAKTIYCKGFPVDSTLDKIQEFFDSHAKVISIYLRRDAKNEFKGSVFATFETNEACTKFIENKDIKYEDNDLIIKLKEEYLNEKKEKRKEATKKEKEKILKNREEKTQEFEEALTKESYVKGALLHFSGTTNSTKREEVKALFEPHGFTVKWVHFAMGETEGYLEFGEEDAATKCLEKATEADQGKLEVNGNQLTCRVLEGDEEWQQWKTIAKNKNKPKPSFGRGRGRKRGNYQGRSGRGGWSKKANTPGGDNQTEDKDDTSEEQASGSGQQTVVKEENTSSEGQAPASAKRTAKEDDIPDKAESGQPPAKQAKTEP